MNKTALNVDENVASLLCYLLGWVSGLAIILIEKKNETVRFNAMQSIIVFGGITVFSIVLGTLQMFVAVLLPLINIIGVILWIVLMVKSYQGEKVILPLASDLAKSWVNKV